MTPEEALKRSNAAQRIYNDPLVKETLDLMEKEVMEAWLACPVRDEAGREMLWRMAVTTRKFRDLLKGTMEAGKLAKHQLESKKTFAQNVVNAFRS